MKKITLVAGLALILVLPTVAGATPAPDRGDKRAATKECNTLRGHTAATREGFRTLFRNFAACVKAHAADEAKEEQSAHKNASQDCREERSADAAAFAVKYGKNGNKRNAFGKCVSEAAKAKEHEADVEDQQEATETKNAAKECASERDADEAAFAAKYGKNANKKNAFGKCVSQNSKKLDEQDDSNDGGSDTTS
jgi:hypothetical protein